MKNYQTAIATVGAGAISIIASNLSLVLADKIAPSKKYGKIVNLAAASVVCGYGLSAFSKAVRAASKKVDA